MESFKMILPSNASMDHYPSNNPANYQTRLNHPIVLEGEWEAGVESICYSSAIENEKEQAQFHITANYYKPTFVNNIYPHTFKVSKENKWLGYRGVIPRTIEEDPSKEENIVKCLNSVNADILKDEHTMVFQFIKSEGRFFFAGTTNGIMIKITPKMAACLQFGTKTLFDGCHLTMSGTVKKSPPKLTREDYRIVFFESALVQRENRFILKNSDEGFAQDVVLEKIKKRWKDQVQKQFNIRLQFTETNKLIIHNYETDISIHFSPNFKKSFHHNDPILHKGEYWAERDFDTNGNYENEYWFVDIYKDTLTTTREEVTEKMTYSFIPRQFATIHDVITHMNREFLVKLANTLKSFYDPAMHFCEISAHNNHSRLTLGKYLTLELSDNLSSMFGFGKKVFDGGEHFSGKRLSTIDQVETHLYILSNFIQPVSYGREKLCIMQDFIHVTEGNEIIGRRFYPISFLPLSTNYIENIHVQIVNKSMETVSIKDSKTILTVHFRKVK